MDLIVMQRYGDICLAPRNKAFSSSTCCDGVRDMRQSVGNSLKSVAKGHKKSLASILSDKGFDCNT